MVRQFFSKKSCSISHFSRSIRIVTGYGPGDRRSISSRDIIFFPPFHQCVQIGSGAHSAHFDPESKQTVWIWPFISIYCHGQECILSFPYACSWGCFYLITLSPLHHNFGCYSGYLNGHILDTRKSNILTRKLNQQLQAIVIFLQWAKYVPPA